MVLWLVYAVWMSGGVVVAIVDDRGWDDAVGYGVLAVGLLTLSYRQLSGLRRRR